MKDTKIEWADHSWSPWRGCTKISPGCANCYAENMAQRFGPKWGGWGKGAERIVAKNWAEPVRWNRDAHLFLECHNGCRFQSTKYGLEDFCPKCGHPQAEHARPTVFPSLCDWLDPEVPARTFGRFLDLIAATPNLTWLLLTKRPELFRTRLCEIVEDRLEGMTTAWNWGMDEPPTNVWVGTSVEDQKREKRITDLLRIPAAGRFLSVEPLLGPVDVFSEQTGELLHVSGDEYNPGRIDWVIIGGESGPGARPCNVEHVRSLVRQCASASVPAFVKQLGANACFDSGEGYLKAYPITHPKGGDPAEWPEDLRIRQFPEGLR